MPIKPLKKRHPIGEEVTHFVTEANQYYAVTLTGRIVNIVRSKAYQPSIENAEDYTTYLWVEAREGFFLFSRRIRNGKADSWILDEEMVPERPDHFFFDYLDALEDRR